MQAPREAAVSAALAPCPAAAGRAPGSARAHGHSCELSLSIRCKGLLQDTSGSWQQEKVKHKSGPSACALLGCITAARRAAPGSQLPSNVSE